MKIASKLLSLSAVLSMSLIASAGTLTTYSGQDDGASTSGPWPLSAAAQAAFLAAAGSTSTITFEGLPLGFYSPIAAAPGVSIAFSGTDYGDGYSGLTTTTYGNLYGFNTTPGGSEYLATSGDTATFNFATPVSAFGFWLTGVQTVFTTSIPVTFNDGSPETLYAPVNVNGGAEFFGFTDMGGSTSSITITDISTGDGIDAWGIDDVSYSTAATTPEPSSLLLLGTGLVGFAGALRRKFAR